MGERRFCTPEVVGSNPISSTNHEATGVLSSQEPWKRFLASHDFDLWRGGTDGVPCLCSLTTEDR